jgi:molybdopterin molybdotransferase
MLTVDEALKAVLDRAGPLPPRRRPLDEALGCVLAEEVGAEGDLPPFDKALVDGYAVRAADVDGPGAALDLGEEIPAGRTPSRPLAPGEAALIMTGAPLPPGADAVVMIEQTRRRPDGRVDIEGGPVRSGQNRLPRGREMRAGDVLLRPGEGLHAARIGLLASVGRAEPLVVPRPRVVVVPTGDELVEPGRAPGPGQIRNSNGPLLEALARACGAEAEARPIAPDDPRALGEALRRGLAADVLVITGGVSAGNRDLVPGALEALGVGRVFHKVRVKPGKPLWFGLGPARDGGGPGPLVFGLPGNPVSGVVGFLLFVRPALEALRGRDPVADRAGAAAYPLASAFEQRGDRPTYHPARLVGDGADRRAVRVRPLDWAGSADLRTVAGADGFAIFPAGDRSYAEGDAVGFLPLPGT